MLYIVRHGQTDSNVLWRYNFVNEDLKKENIVTPLLENIKEIVRNCMNEKGATEVTMPALIPIEIFEKTGRAENFGSSMFSLHDRVNRKYALEIKKKIKAGLNIPADAIVVGIFAIRGIYFDTEKCFVISFVHARATHLY